MLIIVEGPERSGKSQLCTRLAGALKQYDDTAPVVWHRGPPLDHPLNEYEKPLWHYYPGRGEHIIIDRWHVGELVYPQVLSGRRSKMTLAVLAHIERFLWARGAILVEMLGDDDYLLRRWDETPRQRISGVQRHHIPMINSLFTEALELSVLPRTAIRNADYDAEHADRLIRYALSTEAVAASSGGSFTTYVGPPEPKMLIMGDVRGGSAPELGGPAFAPYPGTSGAYLLETLGDALTERQIGIANACDVDNPQLLWERLGRPPTVTLGVNANRFVPWEHGAVPHPQFIRRFFNAYRRQYVDIIMEAAAMFENYLGWRPWGSWAERT